MPKNQKNLLHYLSAFYNKFFVKNKLKLKKRYLLVEIGVYLCN